MKVAVAGIGYVGLSMAILLSQKYEVIAVDVIKEKVDKLNNGIIPIDDKLMHSFIKEHQLNLMATTDKYTAYKDANYIIIATPTNYDDEKQIFDTKSVEAVVEAALSVNTKATIVIKSTIPVGYTESIRKKYNYNNIIFAPEFLRESHALHDSLYPSRIIVGVAKEDVYTTKKAKQIAKMLRGCTIKKHIPVRYVTTSEAEAIKLFSNAYLAMRVAFFNELDTFAEKNSLNTKNIINGICLDTRIGRHYNNPSFGYGGYCLPKDTKQLKTNFTNIPENLISAIVESNSTRKDFVANQVLAKLANSSSKNKTIGIYRLIMKANSSSCRYSSIIGIIKRFHKEGYNTIIYEPAIASGEHGKSKIINNFEEFARMSDIVIANRWDPILESIKEKVYTRDIFMKD